MAIVFQSLAQIKRLYPDTWGLFGNGAVLSFRPGDLETAKWLSERSGEVTVPVLSASDPSSPHNYGTRPSWQQQKRARIPVGKMFSMPQGVACVWLPGDEAPRVSKIRGYFDIPELNWKASPNPYFNGNKSSTSNAGAVSGGGAAMLGIAGSLMGLLWWLLS
jgi:type IV secretory pathway TraG/TraD family ATPase VirD4